MAEVQTLAGKASFPFMGELAERDFEAAFSRVVVKIDLPLDPSAINPDATGGYIPHEGLLTIRRGVQLARLGRFEEALAALNRAVRLTPNNFHAHFFQGDTLSKLNRHKEALVAITRAVELDRKKSSGHFLQGLTFANLQRFDEALKAYDRAASIIERASLGRAQVNRVISSEIEGNKDYTADIENTKTGITGENIMRKNAAKEIIIAPAEAETTRRTEPRVDRGLAEIHRARGWALVQLGKYDEALHVFAKAINLNPENADGHYSQGWLLLNLDRFAEALPAIASAAALAPDNARSHFLHGLALAAVNRHADALPAYDRALDLGLGLDEAAVHFNRGMALGRLERFGEAVEAFDRAVHLDPNEPAYQKGRRWAVDYQASSEALKAANERVAEIERAQSQQQSVASPDTAPARAETTRRAKSLLSEPELAEFRAHAKANPWDSKSGVAPSAHIETAFARWLGRGLGRTDIVSVQPNLASAYAAEVSRDPRKRVEGLAVRPHKLPPDAPRPLSMRRAAELTGEELALKRAQGREAQRRWREAHRAEGVTVRPHKLPPDAPRPLYMRRVAELTEDELAARREKKAAAQKRWREKRQGAAPEL
jgi:tetratricopeptide (TPR) repeat protein